MLARMISHSRRKPASKRDSWVQLTVPSQRHRRLRRGWALPNTGVFGTFREHWEPGRWAAPNPRKCRMFQGIKSKELKAEEAIHFKASPWQLLVKWNQLKQPGWTHRKSYKYRYLSQTKMQMTSKIIGLYLLHLLHSWSFFCLSSLHPSWIIFDGLCLS